MTRTRVALVLAAVALLSVVGTAGLAVATYLRDDEPATAEPLVVSDPSTGARFEVPGEGWVLRGPRSRIFYEDGSGRPAAVVTGPAVYDDGYCAERPGDSNRGFAGFTDQAFGSWRASLDGATGEERRDAVVLADGTPATLRWVRLDGGSGPCAAPDVELAMVGAGDVQVVLVADSGADDTLSHAQVERILTSLRP